MVLHRLAARRLSSGGRAKRSYRGRACSEKWLDSVVGGRGWGENPTWRGPWGAALEGPEGPGSQERFDCEMSGTRQGATAAGSRAAHRYIHSDCAAMQEAMEQQRQLRCFLSHSTASLFAASDADA
eukprot:2216306-Rhodomonas_salina.5